MDTILQAFDHSGSSLAKFFSDLLTSPNYQAHSLASQLLEHSLENLLNVLSSPGPTSQGMRNWALSLAETVYTSQMALLSHKSGGFHFNVRKVTEEQIEKFSIKEMVTDTV
ncbi:hypothetical protein CPB84DRAFT_1846831 [Gymnopilus junonius]|uniref:Uncharacterized protein n=1 Tax=Gymnopilus junonius TaxID=109634 RepID=A0A9P5TND3_GYMJU|nr:hypothetical protein CPB84DRAFT_1846831 [Gymnopilus junonius]